jgi:hemimethylated DNA binding protein
MAFILFVGRHISSRFARHTHGARLSTTTTTPSNTTTTNARLTKTLYRQLLRWCQEAPATIPLTHLLPPVHLAAPAEVNADALRALADSSSSLHPNNSNAGQDLRRLLPTHARIQATQLTLAIARVADIRGLLRAVFRLNRPYEASYQQERLTATFTTLKSLNDLSPELEALEANREAHGDRTGVQYKVGQVVQHAQERWRGVIASWNRPTVGTRSSSSDKAPGRRTSLTTKAYQIPKETAGDVSSENSNDTSITYEVILDAGDARAMGVSSGCSQAPQAALSLVTDAALVRIQSVLLPDFFGRLDRDSKRFLPTPLVAYQYPADQSEDDVEEGSRLLSAAEAKRCLSLLAAVQAMASRLHEQCSVVPRENNASHQGGDRLVQHFRQRLASLSSGNLPRSPREELVSEQPPSPLRTVARHVQELLKFQLELVDLNHQRRTSLACKSEIRYELGDVVRHKVFGFRGVVVAWDHKPVMDVRRWDGLQDIKDPMDKPFYQVIPDSHDCILAFGGERSVRYVCEENLESCPEQERTLAVDMEPVWTKLATGHYSPPMETQYRYGGDLEDDGVTEGCLVQLQDDLNRMHLAAREKKPTDAVARRFSVRALQDFLKMVDTAADAAPIQDTLKEIHKAHPRTDLRWNLDKGMAELMSGLGEKAVETYRSILQEDPLYIEAWNKLATCQYMYGKYHDSLESTEKALELDSAHLQAVIGLGLLHFEQEDYQQAVECFRKAIAVDPWSPVAAKLSLTLDLLDKLIVREEIS